MKKPIIGATENERPNSFAMMSYTAKEFVKGIKEIGGSLVILPIGDADMVHPLHPDDW